MPQKEVSEPRAFACALNKAGHVGNHKTLFACDAHDPEMRMQRRKGIVRDFRAGVGNRRNKGGLTGVGHSKKSHVRKNLKFQTQFTVLTRFPGCCLPGCSVRTRLKVKIPQATPAALGKQLLFPVLGKVGNGFTG